MTTTFINNKFIEAKFNKTTDIKRKENCALIKFRRNLIGVSYVGGPYNETVTQKLGLHDIDCSEKITIICEMN